MRHRAEPARTRRMAIGGAAASSDVWTWPDSALYRSAAVRRLSEEDPTLDGQAMTAALLRPGADVTALERVSPLLISSSPSINKQSRNLRPCSAGARAFS
jgi:hypothetical protein